MAFGTLPVLLGWTAHLFHHCLHFRDSGPATGTLAELPLAFSLRELQPNTVRARQLLESLLLPLQQGASPPVAGVCWGHGRQRSPPLGSLGSSGCPDHRGRTGIHFQVPTLGVSLAEQLPLGVLGTLPRAPAGVCSCPHHSRKPSQHGGQELCLWPAVVAAKTACCRVHGGTAGSSSLRTCWLHLRGPWAEVTVLFLLFPKVYFVSVTFMGLVFAKVESKWQTKVLGLSCLRVTSAARAWTA